MTLIIGLRYPSFRTNAGVKLFLFSKVFLYLSKYINI